ncbi:hypothetical protein C8F01DRAFT_1001790 [Mycena amicta]|nr:hypothetical protein C8F01DRAFT_1001790 [Mycena amicta]
MAHFSQLILTFLQVLSIVGDNASNNDTMMESLVELAPATARLNLATRIRCFAHVLKLVVKVRVIGCLISEVQSEWSLGNPLSFRASEGLKGTSRRRRGRV